MSTQPERGLLTEGEYAALQNATAGNMYKYNSDKHTGYFLLLSVEKSGAAGTHFDDLRIYHIQWLYNECPKTYGDMHIGTYTFLSIFNHSVLI